MEDLETRCRESGIEIVTRQSFLNDPSESVRNLRRQVLKVDSRKKIGTCQQFITVTCRMLESLWVYFTSWLHVECCAKCTNKDCTDLVTSGFSLVGTKTIGTKPISPKRKLSARANKWKRQPKGTWQLKHWTGIKIIKEPYLEWYAIF